MPGAKESAAAQVERFKEAARDIGADSSEAAFDRALRKVASAPPAPMPKADKASKAKRRRKAKSSPGRN